MDQQTGPLNVLQEFMTQPGSLMGPFNDSGYIRHDITGIVNFHHPQIGRDRRKMIVGNLGIGPGGNGQERGFAHIRKAYQPYIGNQLHLQDDVPFFSKASGFSKIGSLPNRILEVDIALSAPAASGCDETFSMLDEVFHHKAGILIDDHRAQGHFDDQVLAIFAVTFFSHTVLAVFCFIFFLVFKIHQGPEVFVRHKNDISAISAVSPIGPAFRYKGFPSEGHAAVSSLTGSDCDLRSIYKHFITILFCLKIIEKPLKQGLGSIIYASFG